MHTDYGTSERIAEIQAIVEKRLSRIPLISRPAAPSLYVKELDRTACRWGMSGKELRRLSDAAHVLNRLGHPLWYAVLASHDLPESETRGLARKFKNTLVLYQRRAGLDGQYWLEALEGEPTVHSNILFPLPASGAHHIENLRRSRIYGAYVDIQSAKGADWFVSYTSKERTPQAHYASRGRRGPRRPGTHPLGDGGGDRVRLSKHLEADLARASLIKPHKRTYAARWLPRLTTPAEACPILLEPHQYGLFDDLPAIRAPAPLGSRPRQRVIRFSAQHALPLVCEPDVVDLLRSLAPTHSEIAAKIGRSRQQVTNIIVGRFGPSTAVVRRVLELSRAA